MATTTTTQIVREAAEIEAIKVGLLQSAKALADQGITIPPQMVAQMSGLQIKATELAEAGIGGYQPYLQEAGYTLGDAAATLGSTMSDADAYKNQALGLMTESAGNVPGQLSTAQAGMQSAINYGEGATQSALDKSQQAVNTAGQTGVGTTLGQSLSGATDAARASTSNAGIAALESARQSQIGGDSAVQGARNITSTAAQALQQAGAFGTDTARQGIAGLAETTGAYDPASAGAYMNEYEDAAVQQALADIRRSGDIQQQAIGAQAVGAGAFGGSRQAVAESELGRNILEQQGRTAAGMRQQGFESAAQRSQQGFESQQGRAQQAAQLTGALGSQGAQSGISAAQSAGQLGLSAEQLAAQTAQQGGQLGVTAAQTSGQLGLSGEQLASANAQALAQTGMSLQQLSASTGMSAAQLIGQLGQSQAQMGMQGAQQSGQMGLQAQELSSKIGQGIGGLGTDYGQLNIAQAGAQSELGVRQAALGELGQSLQQQETGFLFDVGKQQQAQQQAVLEATRQNELAQKYEPYQRVGFLSDIYKGAPTSQQTLTSATAPNVSPAQQLLGLGVAGLSASAGAKKAGLF